MKISHSNRQYRPREYATPADVFLPQTQRNKIGPNRRLCGWQSISKNIHDWT